jgi:predicted ATPase
VSRPRDRRSFGPGPYLLGLEPNPDAPWPDDAPFPYDVPSVAALPSLDLRTPVTLLAGDNGTGKSTIVEAIAAAIGFGEEGGELERPKRPAALPQPVLDDHLLPVASATKPRGGYFLRAESFFNVARSIDEARDPFAPDLSLYGGVPLHEQSHGQSFLALASNRFGGEGIFVLDEPEAALSASGALALLAIIARAARGGAQFIVATHSPILLACPGARIYELTETGVAECAYDDLDAVRVTRGFLEAPEQYLRAVLRED